MPGGPEVPARPGLEPQVLRPKRIRATSVGAAPSASSVQIATSPTSAPTVLGPGAAGPARRAPAPETGTPWGTPEAAQASGRAEGISTESFGTAASRQ
eukprot:5270998-Alexandrium_andersonii.AAC.1